MATARGWSADHDNGRGVGRAPGRHSRNAARSSSFAPLSTAGPNGGRRSAISLSDRTPPNLDHAPQVLGVGDLHVENFGTWRDAESRLVWGINDFDEACCLPYTHDLVRLAASARFAIEERHDEASHAADVPVPGHCSPRLPTRSTASFALPAIASVRLWRCHRSPRREGRSPAVHPRGRRTTRRGCGTSSSTSCEPRAIAASSPSSSIAEGPAERRGRYA